MREGGIGAGMSNSSCTAVHRRAGGVQVDGGECALDACERRERSWPRTALEKEPTDEDDAPEEEKEVPPGEGRL